MRIGIWADIVFWGR